jgi:hypothetical protein
MLRSVAWYIDTKGSEQGAAPILRMRGASVLHMGSVTLSEILVLFYELHGDISQKAITFIVILVRILFLDFTLPV